MQIILDDVALTQWDEVRPARGWRISSGRSCLVPTSAVASNASTVDITANVQTAGAVVAYYAKHTDAATNAGACSTETVSYTYNVDSQAPRARGAVRR